MAFLQQFSSLALQSVVEGIGGNATSVVGEPVVRRMAEFFDRHFVDHSETMVRALRRATENSWKALEIALAGESVWTWLDRADNKAFREQLRTFLNDDNFAAIHGLDHAFRRDCLAELRQARQRGFLGDDLSTNSLQGMVKEFDRFHDPDALWQAQQENITQMVTLAEEAKYTKLARFLAICVDRDNKSSILVVAVRFFFRRELEIDEELFRGLTSARLEFLVSNQNASFQQLAEVFERHHDDIEAMLMGMQSVVLDTHDVVVDLKGQIQDLTKKMALWHREIQPQDSFSIQNEAERAWVKQLIQQYRQLPEQQRQQFPELLNSIGKLEVASGMLREAQTDFQQAAELSQDQAVQAEAHYNCYCAALEHGDFDEAMMALEKASQLDPQRFALFPTHKFAVQKILGAGGFGVAFLCRNRHSSGDVVVKALRGDTLARDLSEVFREASTLEQLDHPAIIRLRDCDFADAAQKRPFLVMDYFPGDTLETYVENHGPLNAKDTADLLVIIADALEAAHSQGILHRDVKPGNVLVQRDDNGWKVKLIDFGLALKHGLVQASMASAVSRNYTLMGQSIAGTYDYASPEQLGRLPGASVGPHSDVYGLAKLACYALFQTTQPLRKHWQQIPEEFADLLEQCLVEEPRQRLTSMSAVINALKPLGSPKASESTPTNAAADYLPNLPTQELTPEVNDKAVPKENQPRQSNWWKTDSGVNSVTMSPIATLQGHEDAVLCLAFSPDASKLISGSADRTIRLWDLQTQQESLRLTGHQDAIWKVDILQNNRTAISASHDRTICLWDLLAQKGMSKFPNKTNRTVTVSPDGRYAISGNVNDGMIRLWEMQNGREIRRFKGHMSWVLSLEFDSAGRNILSSSADGTIRIWDLNSGRELRRFVGHTDQVWLAKYVRSHRVLSCGADRTLRYWDARTGKLIQQWQLPGNAVTSFAVHPGGRFALSAHEDGTVGLWDLDQGNQIVKQPAHDGKTLVTAFSSDGVTAASAGADKKIIIWKIAD